jgi:hypothetical protein
MILQPVGRGTSINVLLGKFRWNKELIGPKNGVNVIFTTPEVFIQSGETVIRVYRNGQRSYLGVSNDYTVSESGGPGTGFDTITLAVAPLGYEIITTDYLIN